MSLSYEYVYLIYGDTFIPVACTGNIKEKQNKQYTSGISLGGKRRVLHFGKNIAREWVLSGDMPVSIAQNLYTLSTDPQYSQATYYLLTPQAMLYNMQPDTWTYKAETSPGIVDGTIVPLSRGQESNQNKLIGYMTPTSPEDTVTGSVYIQTIETATLFLEFFNSSKSYISGKSLAIGSGEPLKRYSITAKAPANTRYSRLTVLGSDYSAGNPAITLGDTLRPYLPPKGCSEVYLEPLEGGHSSNSIETALQNCSGNSIVEGLSVSLLEVS